VGAPLMGLAAAAAGPWYSNSLVLLAVTVVWLVAAYRWYGKWLERRIVQPTDEPTPATAQQDGVDYQPAKPIVLFGHHFASIAGAGPILGPVLAVALFGWGATALWVLLGVVLIGAVHDYLALMVSVRNRGQSLPDVARSAISPSARVLFLVFVWIGLVLVITAFCGAAAKTFVSVPEIVLPTFALMPIAVLFGFLNYKVKLRTAPNTAIALALLLFVIWLGFKKPIELQDFHVAEAHVKSVWLVVLILYGVIASVLPVWVLLQPRDYIATWILIAGMGMGFVGIAWVHPAMNAPAFTGAMSDKGPVWPMLFIIVACGAVSGFHCLVAGGTTSKQLASQRQGLSIGYGSMLVEGALAIMAMIMVGAGLYYTVGQADAAGGGLVLHQVLKTGSPIDAFGRGFQVLTKPFLGPAGKWLGVAGLGMIIGTTMVNAFVMTTLDTSMRLARFITTELAGPYVKPFRNRLVASLAAAVPAYLLAVTPDAFKSIWPMFGAANQLIAALALIVISAYLLKRNKPIVYTVVPAAFMLVTTIAALLWQAYCHLLKAEKPNYTLGVTALILLVLAAVLAVQALLAKRPAATPGPAEG
jgi:carbon starvation protein